MTTADEPPGPGWWKASGTVPTTVRSRGSRTDDVHGFSSMAPKLAAHTSAAGSSNRQ